MLTFTSLGGSSIRVTGAGKIVIVFPTEGMKMPDRDFIALLPVPQESPTVHLISWPGEYNEAGISIKGVGHVEGQQVSYVLQAENLTIAFLSRPLQDWSDKQLEMVGDIDVLVIPAFDAKLVQKLVDEFDPRVLVLTVSDGAESEAVLKQIGAHGERVDEYKLKGSLPAEGRETVVLVK
ncbi:MAG: hypothetical protein Greene041619_481 [Candidatus Peregrinibacteria bacterium Greene0416_19]|nr:MAG: hypothetical protein Greene041619_481 [Candidatus Peregrinibacteria bacterium Greene0416_19]